jgi:hypothetical protein
MTIFDVTLLQNTYLFGNITLLHYWKINFLNQIFLNEIQVWYFLVIYKYNPPSASLHMNISIITSLICANYSRVDRLNIKHLST